MFCLGTKTEVEKILTVTSINNKTNQTTNKYKNSTFYSRNLNPLHVQKFTDILFLFAFLKKA